MYILWFKILCEILKCTSLVHIWKPNLVISKPADGPAPNGAEPPVGMVLTPMLVQFFYVAYTINAFKYVSGDRTLFKIDTKVSQELALNQALGTKHHSAS